MAKFVIKINFKVIFKNYFSLLPLLCSLSIKPLLLISPFKPFKKIFSGRGKDVFSQKCKR